MEKEIATVDIEKFVQFHKKRVELLKSFVDKNIHGRLVYQISFLGLESLAKLLYLEKYPRDNQSKIRVIELLSLPNMGISSDEAKKLYGFWRNSLIHQGFIADPWTTLEGWGEYDDVILSFPHGLKSSVELPPGSIVAVYESRVDYFEEYFKKTNTKEIKLYN